MMDEFCSAIYSPSISTQENIYHNFKNKSIKNRLANEVNVVTSP